MSKCQAYRLISVSGVGRTELGFDEFGKLAVYETARYVSTVCRKDEIDVSNHLPRLQRK